MNKHLKNIGKILLTIFIFTFIDFFFHLIPYLEVPQFWYSWNKLWIGSILGIIAFYLIEWIKPLDKLGRYAKTSFFTLFIILPLEFRYAYIYSYGLQWNVIVLVMHYAILAPLTYFILFRGKRY